MIYIVGEIGINHNGNLQTALDLMSQAKRAGFDAVKFQKRTVGIVYTEQELLKSRDSIYGDTNGALKLGLEFNEKQYDEIDRHAKEIGLDWFASPWDEASVDFLEKYRPPYYKVASASLTDRNLLRHIKGKGRPVILSTGMSTLDEIDGAVATLSKDGLTLLHTTSVYPCDTSELNLRTIQSLKHRYRVPVGYSGHEKGLATTVAAVALGACMIERHITLDRTLWGSDQAASVEVAGFRRLVRDIREVEIALGDGVKRVYESELPVKAKLRRVDTIGSIDAKQDRQGTEIGS